MHRFSMTVKSESIIDRLGDPAERKRAVRWFHDHGIEKVYIESYRHGQRAPESVLWAFRDDIRAAGIEACGCLTPTCLSDRNGRDTVSCFSDPEAQNRLQDIVEMTARLFDIVIIDDFLFTRCTCDECVRLKGEKTWGEFRCELMVNVSRQRVLAPARAVNENVKVILKYPLWYETYPDAGYDVIRETTCYDGIWMGTETREPESREAGRRPQTSASWNQGWMNDVAGEKCGGGWYDPIDTTSATFLEQARQTIIGGARESLLHCYDYLGTDTPGIAIHGRDRAVSNGLADAEAFRLELPGLRQLADILDGLVPYGVLTPKTPNQSLAGHPEAYLPGFVGMLGIPAIAASTLREFEAGFFGVQAAGLADVTSVIDMARREGRPLIVTGGFLDALAEDGFEPFAIDRSIRRGNGGISISSISDTLTFLECPKDLWELTRIDPSALDSLRNRLIRPFGLEFYAPARVSLHLFRSGNQRYEIIENFTDGEIKARIRYSGPNRGHRTVRLTLPKMSPTVFRSVGADVYEMTLPPRSLLLISSDS